MIGFSIPIYNRFDHLQVLLKALMVQTDGDWQAIVIKDGPYSPEEAYLLEEYHKMDSRIAYSATTKRFNDWGHTPRQLGKEILSARCSYVIMTGDDNYYTPNLVEEIHQVQGPGMIYWDMIHSHYNYQPFSCSPGFNQIDIGAFATRSDLAKQLTLSSDYAADGLFVEEFKRKFPSELIYKIHKTLYVHN